VLFLITLSILNCIKALTIKCVLVRMLFSLSITGKNLAMEIFDYIIVVKVEWTFNWTYVSVFTCTSDCQQTRNIYRLF